MSNHLSHTIRKFNRFELKYLITLQAAEKFKQELLANLVPDEHGDTQGSYYISSLYYDSPDYRCYWEKVDGIRVRRKLRIRYYETSSPLVDQTPVFVEIKQRVNRVTQKRRVMLPYQAAIQLCSGRQLPDAVEFDLTPQDVAVVDEVADLTWQYNLCPASLVSYSRLALVGTDYDIGLRVTFDRNLAYRTYDLSLESPHGSLLLFPADWTVVEIKVNERIPYWLTELVAAHNLNLVRVSKYCRSIELAQIFPDPARRFVTI
jgi:SPX domain protein involved in polyphosphate accumulation